jgi:hypothetical protein
LVGGSRRPVERDDRLLHGPIDRGRAIEDDQHVDGVALCDLRPPGEDDQVLTPLLLGRGRPGPGENDDDGTNITTHAW